MKFGIGGTVTVTLKDVNHLKVTFISQPGAIPKQFYVGCSALINNQEVAEHASTVKQTLEALGYKLENTESYENSEGASVIVMTITEAP